MNMAIKKLSLIAAIALVASMVPMAHGVGAATSTEDEQFAPVITGERGEMVFQIDPNFADDFHDNVSVLSGTDATGEKICSSTSDAACASGNGYRFSAVLGPCSTTITVDCIESVTGTSATGTVANGVFSKHFPLRGLTDFTGSPSEGVPSGGTPSLWTLDGLTHGGLGTDYEVAVQISGSKVNGDALKPPRSFSATITPVTIKQTDCPPADTLCRNGWVADTGPDGKATKNFNSAAWDQDHGYYCRSWGENENCTLSHAFPAGAKFAVKVRLSTSPSGWLHGRLQDPTASIDRANNVTTVNVSASPLKVPIIVGTGQFADLPAPIQDSYTKTCLNRRCGTKRGMDDPTVTPLTMAQRQIIQTPSPYSPEAFEQIKLWTGYLKDKASAMPSLWSVRTLSDREMENAPSCIKDGVGVTGIVATNATAYSEGPPSFDKDTSSLNYKVAAMHFEKDGVTPFAGQYSLVLRSDIAECLYGVTEASAQSTISVTGEDGAVKTATSAFTLANGWFTFSATGFSHSAPTIKVKLTKSFAKILKGRSISVAKAALKNGIKIPSGATVRVVVSSSSKKKCSVSGQRTVKAIAKGTCLLSISVTPKKTKAVPRPKTKRSTVKIVIS
ncbi:unannotated protein [freshwater metagenome]|uniref:Unannotated protein n=2 Tax=freshwater metagenome TaxID=449393 RepID=A0A6J6AIB5_9ZZZZ